MHGDHPRGCAILTSHTCRQGLVSSCFDAILELATTAIVTVVFKYSLSQLAVDQAFSAIRLLRNPHQTLLLKLSSSVTVRLPDQAYIVRYMIVLWRP